MARIEIIPTVVPHRLKDVENARFRYGNFTRSIHIDVTDGVFAQNVTWTPQGDSLPDDKSIMYEAHLMAHDPLRIGTAFANAGAKRIIAHVEAFANPGVAQSAFTAWKEVGATEVGLALLLETPLSALEPYIALCDEVVVMTIATIGVQGLPFDERGVGRVSELRARYPSLMLGVDGGVGETNIKLLAHAGASRFCVGSAVASAEHPEQTFVRLKSLAESAIQ